MTDGLATQDQAMLDRYASLMRDWLADNPITAPASSMSWYDMGTGMGSSLDRVARSGSSPSACESGCRR